MQIPNAKFFLQYVSTEKGQVINDVTSRIYGFTISVLINQVKSRGVDQDWNENEGKLQSGK